MTTRTEYLERLRHRLADAEQTEALVPAAKLWALVVEEIGSLTLAAPSKAADRLLTADELASRMNVRKRYVYEHASQWPFTVRTGRKLRFSEQGFVGWVAKRMKAPCR